MKPDLLEIAARYGIPRRALEEILDVVEPPTRRDAHSSPTMAFDPAFEGSGATDLTLAPSAMATDETVSGDSPEMPDSRATMETVDVDYSKRADSMEETNLPSDFDLPLVNVLGPEGKYEDVGLLGSGGMGEVRRVRDKRLGRTLAMKVAHRSMLQHPRAAGRFVEEAQIGAQLQHPGVIPVHELGRLPDGRYFFTMQEIRGRELHDVIYEVHVASSRRGRWRSSKDGWTFRRLMTAFLRVCETMAYAHRRGIIHRDLKPANIMVGEDDEVLVVDWGLALVLGKAIKGELDDEVDNPILTLRTTGAMQRTSFGKISGTPAYMPPEQAHGKQDELDERSDVYALGGILYQILTGRPPYVGEGPMAILTQLIKGPPPPPQDVTRLLVPGELSDICIKAMAQEKLERYIDAREMADAISAWLDGVLQREKALELVKEARSHQRAAMGMLIKAASLQSQGEVVLEDIPPHRPAEEKRQGWTLQDEADGLRRDAGLEEIRAEQKLRGALIHAADLPEAHSALAIRYERLHRDAEVQKNEAQASRAEIVLRDHVSSLPSDHQDRVRLESYLQGTGALTLVTDVPNVLATLFRYENVGRRLEPIKVRSLGLTPLDKVELDPGSYLVELSKPGFETVKYPVWIGRQEHWLGVPPHGNDTQAIWMPPEGSIEPTECYVPAGWFMASGDPVAQGALERRKLWCPGFVMGQYQVTNARYLEFLNVLVAEGREDEALRCVPRERGHGGSQGTMIYGRSEAEGFHLQEDADGDIWSPRWPVVMVDFHGARSFARWLSERTGLDWRLPHDFEWEKSARGIDGRIYPWGDWLDPSWCLIRQSHVGKPLPGDVDCRPKDISPYGVVGMAGNIMDMCLNQIDEVPPEGGRVEVSEEMLVLNREGQFACRGGAFISHADFCRTARRAVNVFSMRQSVIGFRLVRSIPVLQNG